MSASELHTWDDFYPAKRALKPDLILHDIGDSLKRVEVMPQLSEFMSTSTHVILDDIHKPLLRDRAMSWIRRRWLRYVNLKPYTLDNFGRFQWYVTPR